jgi:DNA replication and repair protein RecF
MLVHSLQVRNFRNLRHVDADFSPGINVVFGLNAQGKTNLLESIYLLVTGRSFRTNNDSELIPWHTPDYDGTLIRAQVSKAAGEEQIAFYFNGREKRVLVDGKPITRLANLIGRLNAVLFTPADLLLVRGAPTLRRRFMDIAIGQTSARYLDALQTYQQVLKNRNILLKQAAHRGEGAQTHLDVYDEQLATAGAVIVMARRSALQEMANYACTHYTAIANAQESLTLTYEPDQELATDSDEMATKAALLQSLAESRPEDLRRLATSRGPHRDDFSFIIQRYPARHFASQGQQRTAVLAAKLAEMDYLRGHTGESPLLMLDDLMSELDEERKRALLQYLDPSLQTFVTTTDPQSVTRYARAQGLLKFHRGELTRIENFS